MIGACSDYRPSKLGLRSELARIEVEASSDCDRSRLRLFPSLHRCQPKLASTCGDLPQNASTSRRQAQPPRYLPRSLHPFAVYFTIFAAAQTAISPQSTSPSAISAHRPQNKPTTSAYPDWSESEIAEGHDRPYVATMFRKMRRLGVMEEIVFELLS